MIVAPYTNDEGQVLLDTPTPNIAIQGKISDESRIKSITVGNFTASYNPNELNPSFTATLNVADLNKLPWLLKIFMGTDKKQNSNLTEKLFQERPQIIQWQNLGSIYRKLQL